MWREIYHGFRRWAKVSELSVAAYKRTEITLETDRIWIIRKLHSRRAWCAECGREVDMVRLKEAEALRGIAQPLITTEPMLPGGRGDSRGCHWSQAADGSPLVCLESVLKSRQWGSAGSGESSNFRNE
jgi:hypothetical protein